MGRAWRKKGQLARWETALLNLRKNYASWERHASTKFTDNAKNRINHQIKILEAKLKAAGVEV